MTNDLTFITNEENKNLADRFATLIKDTRFFDCLVGYFYTSGFNQLYTSLEKTEKIRILVGISTSKTTFDLIQESKTGVQQKLNFSHKETKDEFSKQVAKELEESKDSSDVEEGIKKFEEGIELVKDMKEYLNTMEIKIKELKKNI